MASGSAGRDKGRGQGRDKGRDQGRDKGRDRGHDKAKSAGPSSAAKVSEAKARPIKLKLKAKAKPKAAAKANPRATAKAAVTTSRGGKPKLKPKLRSRKPAAKPVRLPKPKLRPDLIGAVVTRRIESEADLVEGVAALRAACQVMAKVHDLAGAPPLRRRQGGFEGLARIIVGQQLSVASAAAIWGRTEKLVQPFTPQGLLALSDAELASAGLSGPKIRTLRAIAQACVAGLDFDALETAHDAHVHDALTAVTGIGPWTADIYLMFCLGRADAWAPGDLALQIAVQQAFGLKERPDKEALLEIAERWRPWRGVAARLLWAYYAVAKAQEKSGALPV